MSLKTPISNEIGAKNPQVLKLCGYNQNYRNEIYSLSSQFSHIIQKRNNFNYKYIKYKEDNCQMIGIKIGKDTLLWTEYCGVSLPNILDFSTKNYEIEVFRFSPHINSQTIWETVQLILKKI